MTSVETDIARNTIFRMQISLAVYSAMSGGAISEGDVAVLESICECNFHSCMSLPCRHIFFFRKHKNMSSFDQCLVEPRWTKTYYKKNHVIFDDHPCPETVVTVTPRRNAISRKWPTGGISGCYPWDGTTRHYTRNYISKTVHCQTDLHSEDCVACDVCLNWYHLRCIGLRFAPKKNLLVLPKLPKITLNIINLIHCIYLLSYLKC